MSRILLIARREFLANVTSRGFLVLLLVMPVFAIVSAVVTAVTTAHQPPADVVMLADRTGNAPGSVEAIARRFQIEAERAEIRFLARAARGEKIAAPAGAVWDWPPRFGTDADVAAFEAAGGLDAQLKALHLEEKAIDRPDPQWRAAKLPDGISAELSDPELRRRLDPYFQGSKLLDTPDGPHRLRVVVVVTGTDPASATIMTRDPVTRDFAALVGSALSPNPALTTALRIEEPPPTSYGETHQDDLRKAVGRVASTLLFIIIMTITGFLLQGMFEERSSRLLEMLLAAVTPTELMSGKLLGIGGLAVVISLVWGGAAMFGLAAAPPPFSDLARPVLAILLQPDMIFWMAVYLVAGYLVIAPIYVTIGSLADSPQDAQAFLVPVLVLVVFPTLAVGPLISQGGSTVVEVMSWIPLYAPVVMLGRVGVGDVTLVEKVGTSLEIAAFVALEIRYLGRVFRHGILRTGKPPKLRELGGLMRREPEKG